MVSTLLLAGLVAGFGMAKLPVFAEAGSAPAAKQPVSQPRPSAPSDSVAAKDITLAPVSSADHVRGAPDAKITLVEFSDTECPFCKRFHVTMRELLKKYPDDLRWVYRHFPLDQLHSKARKESEATECAAQLGGEQGFWKYLDRLFEVTPSNDGLDPAQLPAIAQQVGLNRVKFEECLSSSRHAKRVADQLEDAQNAGGRGTPYSVLIGPDGSKYPISGALPIEKIEPVIKALLGK